jgi:AcrR family transcriptional regulator
MSASSHSAAMKHSQSCPKPPNRREKRRAETRERIIRCALRLFSEHGVAGTTVEDITNAADIGKGTFFNYFATKEHIIAGLCELQLGKIRKVASRAVHSGEPIEAAMFELAMTINADFAHCPALVQSILVPLFSSEAAVRSEMTEHLKEDRLILGELMAVGQKRGELRGDLTPVELAIQFQRMVFGTTLLWSLDPSSPLSNCLKQAINVLWSGIRARGCTDDP